MGSKRERNRGARCCYGYPESLSFYHLSIFSWCRVFPLPKKCTAAIASLCFSPSLASGEFRCLYKLGCCRGRLDRVNIWKAPLLNLQREKQRQQFYSERTIASTTNRLPHMCDFFSGNSAKKKSRSRGVGSFRKKTDFLFFEKLKIRRKSSWRKTEMYTWPDALFKRKVPESS